MAVYTTINDPSAHFQVATWSGNNSNQAITNDGNSNLQPDLVWIKARNETSDHALLDSTRGLTKRLHSNTNDQETNDSSATMSSFDSDGFTMTQYNVANDSDDTGVAWQWKANGGTTSSDSNGDQTSTVQANTTAGFSIATFSASNSAGQTVGHGLGSAPDMYIWKSRARADNWYIYHRSSGAGGYYRLNTNDAFTSNTNVWSNTNPSSTLIYYGGNSLTNNNENHVIYSFKSIQGFSKFGVFKGNGNANGPFIYTGFQPAWLMIKEENSGGGWGIWDNQRNPSNTMKIRVLANTDAADDTSNDNSVDFLSNGFKMRTTSGGFNQNNTNIIYMAFAEHPLVTSDKVPTTAR